MPGGGLDWVDGGVLPLVVLAVCVGMFFTFLAWRNGYVRGWRAARDGDPACPACGYDLSGPSHRRCPECGRGYRLDELWRAYMYPDRARRRASRGEHEVGRKGRDT